MEDERKELLGQAAGLLKKYFGYDTFRKGQEELILAILSGQDALGIMPTGSGKSLCYQIPALMMPGITLVVSPLISLMKDQVTALNQAGVHAAWLNSSLTPNQYAKALFYAEQGRYKIIYVAPERLLTDSFLRFASCADISMVAVDESHCASQWGQDFRPSYLKIPEFICLLPRRPVVSAFTATAARKVQEDIRVILRLNRPRVVLTGFDRENLYFEVRQPKKKKVDLLGIVERHKGESGIIYCSTRKAVEEIHQFLFVNGYPVTRYHAGLSDAERAGNQEDFVYDRLPVMVATNAFGMGIDKSNVRYVIHYNMPKDLESYYQEAGRAGRDGEPAECILLYGKKDVATAQMFIESSPREDLDDAQRLLILERERERLKKMQYYCLTKNCLRAYILDYFGDQASHYCGNCSGCLNVYEEIDVTELCRTVLNCVWESRQRYGAGVILDTLRGSRSAKTLQYRLDRLPQFGALEGTGMDLLEQTVHFLAVEGYLDITTDRYPVLRISRKGREFMEEPHALTMKKQIVKQQAEKTAAGGRSGGFRAGANAGAVLSDDLAGEQNALFLRLKELRIRIAKEEQVPAYIVFNDKTLVQMAIRQPSTKAQLLEIQGIGTRKLEKYGDRFLEVLNG